MYTTRYDYDAPEPSAVGEEPDFDAETEYKKKVYGGSSRDGAGFR